MVMSDRGGSSGPGSVGREVGAGAVLAVRVFFLLVLPALVLAVSWSLYVTDSAQSYLIALHGGGRRSDVPNSIAGTASGLARAIVTTMAGLWFVALAHRKAGALVPPRFPMPAEGARERFYCTAGLFAAALCVSMTAFSNDAPPVQPAGIGAEPLARHLDNARALLAGVLEEPFYSALPVLALAAVPWRWWNGARMPLAVGTVFVVSALARGTMHLYQSLWAGLAACLWGLAAIYAYYRYRSLLGLITTHTAWNAVAVAQSGGNDTMARVLLVGVAGLAVVFCLYTTRVRTAPAASP
ncbi:CPBP family intramembrane glutamic endopeptidase [Nocardia yamanashiensis]|uniref:CPBP family intramembrane glutamic endopeptidase n=1 Tax=Nocardia yamanashiensis TaxID=209247 RepID=UPI000A625115|nr:CPBP family intramembrane glutamic endopeptidase [Nocardia yamanashiensis]